LVLALIPLSGCGEGPPLESTPTTPIHVSADGRGDYATLAEAVREASTGATILLDPGRYELSGSLDVFRSLRIIGTSRADTVVTGAATGHLLGFSGYGSLELRGLTIRHTGGPDDEPTDVVLVRGGEAAFSDCAFTGAVSGRVSVRTGRGRVFETRGGAGVRALGETSLRLDACVFADDSLAGLVVEPHVSLEVGRGCRGLGRPGGEDEPVILARGRGPRSAGEIAAVLDADVPALLRAMNVPGAVVTVVKDDRLLYSRGFGFADLAAGAPVDARRTRFRIASVTKCFTATAVMQLRERGLLRLNDPVDTIVSAAPRGPADSRRMTIADLLTHAAGFDERWIDIAAPAGEAPPSLDEVVRERPASRILPPGTVSSYANYDSTLAGAAVEAAAGTSYERWVERAILVPLGMTATTFDPRTDAAGTGGDPEDTPGTSAIDGGGVSGDVARSYRWDGGQRPLPPDRFASRPSGGLWSTGTDMAAFMLVHLQGGRIEAPVDIEAPADVEVPVDPEAPVCTETPGDPEAPADPAAKTGPARDAVRILSAASVAAMQERRVANGPPLPGFTYGFAERFIQNRRALQHTGEFNGYASLLFLVPSERLGVFVATNAERPRFCDEVVVRLMQRL
ncbi:MAG: serine hydrolase, partial [Actinobacteria bacterium]|nr:serine hydrolase [Actinomycetota bacterium]